MLKLVQTKICNTYMRVWLGITEERNMCKKKQEKRKVGTKKD